MKKLLTVVLLVAASGCASPQKAPDHYEINAAMSVQERVAVTRRAAIAIDKKNVLTAEDTLNAIKQTAYEIPCEEVGKSLVKVYSSTRRLLAATGLELSDDGVELNNTKNLPMQTYLASVYLLRISHMSALPYEDQYLARCDMDDLDRIRKIYK